MTIIVYHIGALGDTVVSIPALRAIRESVGPKAEILLLHNMESAATVTPSEVLDGAGLVDRYIQYKSDGNWFVRAAALIGLCRRVRRLGAEKVVYLAPGDRSHMAAWRDRVFFQLCGIKELVGFHSVEEYQSSKKCNHGIRPVKHEAIVRLERLSRDGLPTTAAFGRIPLLVPPARAKATVARWLEQSRQRHDLPLVAFCPGSRMQSKRWPRERFADLGKRLLDRYSSELVIVGGAEERSLGNDLIRSWKSGLNAAGSFSVLETAALLEKCALTITLDTGPMHLAAAVGTRCIALFSGRDNPGKWDPLGDGHIIIRKEVPCTGCLLTVCPIESHPCMTDISSDEVWTHVDLMMPSIATIREGAIER